MSDIELHYNEYGSGFPLVLLHGNGGESDYFKNQIDDLSAFYRVITVDTRGHGDSPRGHAPFTLEQFADDLKSFLDMNGLQKIHLLGFSDGGNIALIFALKHSEYIERLVINGANIFPAGLRPIVLAGIRTQYVISSLLAAVSRKAARKRDLMKLMTDEPHINPQQLGSIKLPVLVIAGTDDLIQDSHTRLISASLPDAKLVILNGPHSIARDNSRQFNRAVLDFLE